MKPPNRHINGHSFVYYNKPTYCDNCEQFMWSLSKPSAVRCKKCKYACHECCMTFTNFKCPKKKIKNKNINNNNSPIIFKPYIKNKNEPIDPKNEKPIKGFILSRQDEISRVNEQSTETLSSMDDHSYKERDSVYSTSISLSQTDQLNKQIEMAHPSKYSSDELFKRVFLYNKGSSGLAFTMCQDSCNFRGFLRIQINLNRPVNIRADFDCMTLKRALSTPSESEEFSRYAGDLINYHCNVLVNTTNGLKPNLDVNFESSIDSSPKKHWIKQTFTIPKETNTALHVRSDTTSREIITLLLKKYSILGNPLKYSLYVQRKCSEILGEAMVEIPDDACPLMLLLEWGPLDNIHIISLSEKLLKDNIYEHFSIPELLNFQRIITNEKIKVIQNVEDKFSQYSKALNDILLSLL